MNTKTCFLCAVSVSVIAISASSVLASNVIFSHAFNGEATDLNGTAVDMRIVLDTTAIDSFSFTTPSPPGTRLLVR